MVTKSVCRIFQDRPIVNYKKFWVGRRTSREPDFITGRKSTQQLFRYHKGKILKLRKARFGLLLVTRKSVLRQLSAAPAPVQ